MNGGNAWAIGEWMVPVAGSGLLVVLVWLYLRKLYSTARKNQAQRLRDAIYQGVTEALRTTLSIMMERSSRPIHDGHLIDRMGQEHRTILMAMLEEMHRTTTGIHTSGAITAQGVAPIQSSLNRIEQHLASTTGAEITSEIQNASNILKHLFVQTRDLRNDWSTRQTSSDQPSPALMAISEQLQTVIAITTRQGNHLERIEQLLAVLVKQGESVSTGR